MVGPISLASISSEPGKLNTTETNQIKNRQNQTNIASLYAALPTFNTTLSSPFSTSFLNQVYDAKALTPHIINNYLSKVDDSTQAVKSDSPSNVNGGESILDKLLAENKSKEPATADPENMEVQSDPSRSHFGIVGEIFEKYA